MPTPAADSLEAAISCSDIAKGSKAGAAGAAAGLAAGLGTVAGFAAAAGTGFRFAKEGRALPGVGFIVVVDGKRPIGAVPRAPVAAVALFSAIEDVGFVVDVIAAVVVPVDDGETRRFFRDSIMANNH